MRTGRMWAVAAVLTVLGLVGAGCDDDDEDSTSKTGSTVEQGVPTTRDDVDAAAEGDEASDVTDEEEDRCAYEAFLDALGPDGLEGAGLSHEDIAASDGFPDLGLELTEAQADSLYEGLDACFDVRAMAIDGMSEGATAEEIACIEANLTDDLVKQVMVAYFTDGEDFLQDPELGSALGSALMPCVTLDSGGT